MAFIQSRDRTAQKDFRSRLDVIRNPGMNHMSRTRTKIERYSGANKEKYDPTKGSPTGKRRVKAYDGAHVADPRRQVTSGFNIAGQLLSHVHNFVIDFDLTSLYPSIMILLNLSPETFVGKLLILGKYDIPKYEYIHFIDKTEQNEYRVNANDFFTECYQGKHWWAIAEIFLHLHSIDDILNYINDHIDDFAA